MSLTDVSDALPRVRRDHVIASADALTKDYTVPTIPVIEIAESQGVEVVFSSFGNKGDKVAGFCDFEAEKLYVNGKDYPTRQNFTIAHELGHWILHREFFLKNPKKYNILPRFHHPEKNTFEDEANMFAANLLVPKKLIKPVKNIDPVKLSEIFEVSRLMMEIRLKEI